MKITVNIDITPEEWTDMLSKPKLAYGLDRDVEMSHILIEEVIGLMAKQIHEKMPELLPEVAMQLQNWKPSHFLNELLIEEIHGPKTPKAEQAE